MIRGQITDGEWAYFEPLLVRPTARSAQKELSIAEPTLSRTGIRFIYNPLRRREELGIVDRDDPERHGPEWHKQCYDEDRAYARKKIEREIESAYRATARRREAHRRAKTGRRPKK